MFQPDQIKTFRGTWDEILSHQGEIPPGSTIELRVYPPSTKDEGDSGDFGGLTIAEAFADLLSIENSGPPDLSTRAKDYLVESEFGVTKHPRSMAE